MTSRREFYRRTEAAWPAKVPPVTGPELVRAARRLYRFVRRKTWRGEVRVSSGNRYPYIVRGVIVVNPDKGWRENVHGLSHALGGGHSKEHARLEARMVREVVRRGWLDGRLKDPPPRPAPSAADRAQAKLAALDARIARWEAKARRAATALRKLRRSRSALARRQKAAVALG